MGRDPVRLVAAGRVLDKWASTPPAQYAAALEAESNRTAIASADWTALKALGDINGAMRRMCELVDAAVAPAKPPITTGRV